MSDDRALVDVDLVHHWMCQESYWAAGLPREVMAKAIENSLVLGLYTAEGDQAGFARLVTDRATFAWLCDVFVTAEHRGGGAGSFLVQTAVGHPEVAGIRQLLMAAPGRTLYRRHGYGDLVSPERWMERPAPQDASGTPDPADQDRAARPRTTQPRTTQHGTPQHQATVTIHQVRSWAMALPRTEEHLIRDYVKFRVGRIVYAAVSPDETILGFGFPKEERPALLAAEPDRFLLERPSDQRYNWIDARMATLTPAEAREFITDAWQMVVPKRVAAAHLGLA